MCRGSLLNDEYKERLISMIDERCSRLDIGGSVDL